MMRTISKESRLCLLHFAGPNTVLDQRRELAFPAAGEPRAHGAVWHEDGLGDLWESCWSLTSHDSTRLTFKDEIKSGNHGFCKVLLITSFIQIWKWVLTRAIDFPSCFVFSMCLHMCVFAVLTWKAGGPLSPLSSWLLYTSPLKPQYGTSLKKSKLQQSGSTRGGEGGRTDEDSKCLEAGEGEELRQMLPAVAQRVGVTSALKQTHKSSNCAVALLLSFSIRADTSPQPSFCPAVGVLIHHCLFWMLCSVQCVITASC